MRRVPAVVAAVDIGSRIVTVRGHRVILDVDLARIYGAPTNRLNEQVKRNAKRFPQDFRFQLTKEEWGAIWSLRSQTATLENGRVATSKSGRGRYRKYLPYAFTEHGDLYYCLELRQMSRVSPATETSIETVQKLRRQISGKVRGAAVAVTWFALANTS
jgi:hypothetical protein